MFKILYKYNSNFYLNAEIYEDLSKSEIDINVKNLTLYFIEKINLSNKFKIKLHKVTERLDFIEFFTDYRIDKDLLTYFFNPYKELLPPWIVFLNIFDGSPRWNQGIEEDYCIKFWMPYWKNLDALSKDKYLDKYNCNMDWKEWLSNSENYFN